MRHLRTAGLGRVLFSNWERMGLGIILTLVAAPLSWLPSCWLLMLSRPCPCNCSRFLALAAVMTKQMRTTESPLVAENLAPEEAGTAPRGELLARRLLRLAPSSELMCDEPM